MFKGMLNKFKIGKKVKKPEPKIDKAVVEKANEISILIETKNETITHLNNENKQIVIVANNIIEMSKNNKLDLKSEINRQKRILDKMGCKPSTNLKLLVDRYISISLSIAKEKSELISLKKQNKK